MARRRVRIAVKIAVRTPVWIEAGTNDTTARRRVLVVMTGG